MSRTDDLIEATRRRQMHLSGEILASDRPLRVLYLMYIPWNWVRARPQYLAEALTEVGCSVVVMFPSVWRRRVAVSQRGFTGETIPYRHLPFRFRLRFVYAANRLLLKIWFALVVRHVKHDVIWIPFPEIIDYLPKHLDGLVVYDCMDDALAFDELAPVRERLQQLEGKLVARADAILTSSTSLANKLTARYGTSEKIRVVRNAFGGAILVPAGATGLATRRETRIGYVGNLVTLDREAIWVTLDRFPAIAYDLIGPAEADMNAWRHPRVTIHGLVAHDKLAESVKDDQCLIMPYVINERVLSADSMKLYDYINLGKPIVSVWYPEIERFRPFVEFYKTPDELVAVLDEMIANGFPRKYTEQQRLAFLEENSWAKRAQVVVGVLDSLIASTVSSRGTHG